jgi:hypothetical protein
MRSKTVDRLLKSTPKDVEIFVDWYADLVVRINQLLRENDISKKIEFKEKNQLEGVISLIFIFTKTISMSTQEFLTDWIIKYVEKNYSNLKITFSHFSHDIIFAADYDGAYGFNDNRFEDIPKAKLSKLVKDLKEDFEIVEWVLLEVLWWDETIVTKDKTKDESVTIYNLDGTYIKATSVENLDKPYQHYSEWVWEYYTPIIQDVQSEKLYSIDDVHRIIKYMHKNYSNTEDELAKPYTDKGEDLPDDFFDVAYNLCLKRAMENIV